MKLGAANKGNSMLNSLVQEDKLSLVSAPPPQVGWVLDAQLFVCSTKSSGVHH
jgi:hypothetical protein